MSKFSLPTQIKIIDVFTNHIQQGLLTQSGHYNYQPIQEKWHVSLTMTKPLGADIYLV